MEINMIKSNAADKKVLEMVVMAIEESRQNTKYYFSLMGKVTSMEDKEIIRQIYLDEIKHDKMFSDIYIKLSGKEFVSSIAERRCSPYLVKEFEKNIFAKLDSVEFYRQIYFMFLNLEIRDMLFEMITDEQSNATKFSYLLFRAKAI